MANHLQAKSGTVGFISSDAENKDLFYRRLREGNKDNWLDELAHSERETASIEDKLVTCIMSAVVKLLNALYPRF